MEARLPIVVGITAIVGGLAWLALRSPTSPGTTPEAPGAVTSATSPGKAAIGAPLPPALQAAPSTAGFGAYAGERPALPATESVPATRAATPTAFAQQDRDPEWAPKTELEIERRFRAIPGARLQSTECHFDQCLLVVAGSQDELSRTLATIDEPTGLHGFAQNILLTAPEEKDGKLVLRVYAKFVR